MNPAKGGWEICEKPDRQARPEAIFKNRRFSGAGPEGKEYSLWTAVEPGVSGQESGKKRGTRAGNTDDEDRVVCHYPIH
jgi:hypothetical protein